MANLPLLYWAGLYARDASFVLAAEAHAMMTRDAFIRSDASTYHAVEYDLATGERQRGFTFQGYADKSCWPRGQAWAIYGYVRTAEATGKLAYLELAEKLADYFLTRTGSDLGSVLGFRRSGNTQCSAGHVRLGHRCFGVAGSRRAASGHPESRAMAKAGDRHAVRSLPAISCNRCGAPRPAAAGMLFETSQ